MANTKREIKFLKKKLNKNPDSPLFARLADLHLEEGDVDKAIEICEEGLQKHPYYVTAHVVMSKCYAALGMKDQVKSELKRCLLFDPQCLSATKMLGDIMKDEGWENLYQDNFRRLSKMDPLDAEVQSIVEEFGPAEMEQQEIEPQPEPFADEVETEPVEVSLEDEAEYSPEEEVTEEAEKTSGSDMVEEVLEPYETDEELESSLAMTVGGESRSDEISALDEVVSKAAEEVEMTRLEESEVDESPAEMAAVEPEEEESDIISMSMEDQEQAIEAEESPPDEETQEDDIPIETIDEEPGRETVAAADESEEEAVESWDSVAEGEQEDWDTFGGAVGEELELSEETASFDTDETESGGEISSINIKSEDEESEILKPEETEEEVIGMSELSDEIDHEKVEELDSILSEDEGTGEGVETFSPELEVEDGSELHIIEGMEEQSENGEPYYDTGGDEEPAFEEETEILPFPESDIEESEILSVPKSEELEESEELTFLTEDEGLETTIDVEGAELESSDEELPEIEELSEVEDQPLDLDAEEAPSVLEEEGEDFPALDEIAMEEKGEELLLGDGEVSGLEEESGELPPPEEGSEIAEDKKSVEFLLEDNDLTPLEAENELLPPFEKGKEEIEEDTIRSLEDEDDTSPFDIEDISIEVDDEELPLIEEELGGEGVGPDDAVDREDLRLLTKDAESEQVEELSDQETAIDLDAEEQKSDEGSLPDEAIAGGSSEELTEDSSEPASLKIIDPLEGEPKTEFHEEELLSMEEDAAGDSEGAEMLMLSSEEDLDDLPDLKKDELTEILDTEYDKGELREEYDLKSGREREFREADESVESRDRIIGTAETELLPEESQKIEEEVLDEDSVEEFELRDIDDIEAEFSGRAPVEKEVASGREFDIRELEEIEADVERKLREKDEQEIEELKTSQRPDETDAAQVDELDVLEEDKSFKDIPEAFATFTLGEIYVSQGEYDKAIAVYKHLKKKNPEDKKIISKLRRTQRLRRKEQKAKEKDNE